MAREPQQLFRENLLQRFHDPDLKDFVQSTLNILSDGIDIDSVNGLKLEAKGTQKKLISFYEKIKEKSPVWDLAFDDGKKSEGLNISEKGNSRLFLKTGGNIGIGNTNPLYKLQVDGMVASHGRVGDFANGTVPADGEWHVILDNLDGCQGFEALAHIIDAADERHALTHAILLMSNKKGNRNKIHSVDAASSWLWGRFLNKIRFRWRIDMQHSRPGELRYCLDLRSRSRYGMPGGGIPLIFFRLSKLWDRNFENGGQSYEPASSGKPDSFASNAHSAGEEQRQDTASKPKKITIKPS